MVVSSNLLLITISSFYSYAILLSNTLHILSIYQLTPLNFFTILLYPSISVAFPMPNHLVITILYISYFLKSFFLINIGILYLLLFSSAIISEYKIKAQNKSNVCSVLYPFSFTLKFPVKSPCHNPIYCCAVLPVLRHSSALAFYVFQPPVFCRHLMSPLPRSFRNPFYKVSVREISYPC